MKKEEPKKENEINQLPELKKEDEIANKENEVILSKEQTDKEVKDDDKNKKEQTEISEEKELKTENVGENKIEQTNIDNKENIE